MAIDKPRASLARWQLRLHSHLRRRRIATVVLIVAVVAAAEWRVARHRPTDGSPSDHPVAQVAAGSADGSDPATAPRPGDGTENDPGVLGSNERAVAIAPPLAMPTLSPGDRVEILAIGLDELGVPTATGLGPAVRVIAADEGAIVLAVDADAVAPILAAQAGGPIDVVLLP